MKVPLGLFLFLIIFSNNSICQVPVEVDQRRQVKRIDQYQVDSLGFKFERYIQEFNTNGDIIYLKDYRRRGAVERNYEYDDSNSLKRIVEVYPTHRIQLDCQSFKDGDTSVVTQTFESGFVSSRKATWTDSATGNLHEVKQQYGTQTETVTHPDGYVLSNKITRTETGMWDLETYTNKGLASETTRKMRDGSIMLSSKVVRDSSSNVIQILDLEGGSKYELNYDSNGLLSETIKFRLVDSLWIQDYTRTRSYELDWQGNWTQRKVYLNGNLEKTVHRDIWYYD